MSRPPRFISFCSLSFSRASLRFCLASFSLALSSVVFSRKQLETGASHLMPSSSSLSDDEGSSNRANNASSSSLNASLWALSSSVAHGSKLQHAWCFKASLIAWASRSCCVARPVATAVLLSYTASSTLSLPLVAAPACSVSPPAAVASCSAAAPPLSRCCPGRFAPNTTLLRPSDTSGSPLSSDCRVSGPLSPLVAPLPCCCARRGV